ncbi:MAG: RNA-binding cell elongation regulator Jag/EloR [Chloroflexota bacterium]
MSVIKHEIEARGANVDAAIENGLAQLGVSRSDVMIDILDEGSRGLLGLGSRDAVVRLTMMRRVEPEPEPEPEPVVEEPEVVEEVVAAAPAPPEPQPVQEEPEPVVVEAEEEAEEEAQQTEADDGDEVASDMPSERDLAVEMIGELLDKMAVTDVTISTKLSEVDDVTNDQVDIIDIHGNDLGVLIGPRGDTLDSLQYISRLMVGHQRRDRARFVVDVQNYRERREQALRKMAERMAKKAVARNRPVGLEAMPAHERRIIHMALRDHPDVHTNSTGEGSRRRVRIFPK